MGSLEYPRLVRRRAATPHRLTDPMNTHSIPGGRRRALRFGIAGAGVLVAMVTLVVLSAVEYGHQQSITLPSPGGPFAVGRVVQAVTFPHAQPSESAAEVQRVLWCWYPATPNAQTPAAEYLPSSWRRALEQHRGLVLNRVANRDLAGVRGHSLANPPVAAAPSPLPVVFLRAGLAALMVDYTSLAEHLASHGYVVIGVDVPARTALVVLPDNRVVTRPVDADPERLSGDARTRAVDQLIDAWTDELVQLADGLATPQRWLPELEGRIDATHISVVGHSLGGATAAEFCRRDVRCDLGVDLDGALGSRVVTEGLSRPFAFVLSDHGSGLDPERRAIADNIQSVFERLPPNARWRATIRGANHFSFSDQMLVRNPAPMAVLRGLGFVTLDPRRGLEVGADVARRLVDRRRAGRMAGGLDIRTGDVPELVLH